MIKIYILGVSVINQVKEKIALNLKEIRKNKHLKAVEMANLLEINPRTYGAYERCEITPGLDLIIALHQKFNIDPLWLLFGKSRDNQDITTIITKLENIEKIITKG